jgi:phosphomethylpyrimidine synthase
MSAIPEEFLNKTAAVSEEVTRPFANSRKVHVQGSRSDLRVPMREVTQHPTQTQQGIEENPPVYVYDTSGPYTDPAVQVDLMQGIPDVRTAWIEERGDTELLAGPTSEYGRVRQSARRAVPRSGRT